VEAGGALMATTPNNSFSTLTLLPGWDVSYSVEFINHERLLGNNYLQITDGGNANPVEIVGLNRSTTIAPIDSAVSDLKAFGGFTAFNWRSHPGGNYKLYFCTSLSEGQLSTYHKSISAELSRHPDPQYDPQPAVVADGTPWGVLTQPIRWGAEQAIEANPVVIQYRPGEVEARRKHSLFNAQNTKTNYPINYPDISSTRLSEIELFLRQRRGRIPFQINTGAGVISTLWICSKWNVELKAQRTATVADMRYSLNLELRQAYRGH
jgi:phage-related protein